MPLQIHEREAIVRRILKVREEMRAAIDSADSREQRIAIQNKFFDELAALQGQLSPLSCDDSGMDEEPKRRWSASDSELPEVESLGPREIGMWCLLIVVAFMASTVVLVRFGVL